MAYPPEAKSSNIVTNEINEVRNGTRSFKKKDMNVGKVKAGGGSKNCILHGSCKHTAEMCWTINKLKERGIKLSYKDGRVLEVIDEDDKVQNDDRGSKNKFGCYSSFENSVSFKNPFRIEIMISRRVNKALIDRDADVSLIDAKWVPLTCTIRKDKLPRILSASGNRIKIVRLVERLPIKTKILQY